MASCLRSGKRAKVILSNITNVYKNLALENWILHNWNFAKFDCLLVYQNTPCVVIGRFQNVWKEVDTQKARSHGVKIARRVSGGGAVYHDLGNVNFSFFTDKKSHCPARNLAFLSASLNHQYGLMTRPNKRHDLYIGESKVSGSASRIIRTGSFHHCTLLVSSDLDTLSGVLHGDSAITGTGTDSLRSPTTNLNSASRDVITPRDVTKPSRNITKPRDVIAPRDVTTPRDVITPRDIITARDVTTPRDITSTISESYLRLYYPSLPRLTADTWTRSQDTPNRVLVVEEVEEDMIDRSHETEEWIFCRSPRFTKTLTSERGDLISVIVDKGRVRSIVGLTQSLESLVGRLYQPEVILREVNLLQGRGF